jgi:glycosyltransferase involved in cell wall biosynthesis
MTKDLKYFESVTLLITHYNRSSSLERLLSRFSVLNVSFFEVIVSDDGSRKEHIEYLENLKSKFAFTLITSDVNKGLGNNINKGQDAVNSPFTLYVQEDFIPLHGFSKHFENGLRIITEDVDTDSLRFYSYIKYPSLQPFKDGFSLMIFDKWSLNLDKATMYSDHPHLRRSTFMNKFGRYTEIKKSDQTEYDMMISFIKNKGKGYFFNDFKSVFDQVNSEIEPSTVKRNYWRNSNLRAITILRQLYRQIKFNYNYFLK